MAKPNREKLLFIKIWRSFLLLSLLSIWACSGGAIQAPLDANPSENKITEAGNPPSQPKKLRLITGALSDLQDCSKFQVIAFNVLGHEKKTQVGADCSFGLELATGQAWGIQISSDKGINQMKFHNGLDTAQGDLYFHADGVSPLDLGELFFHNLELVPQFEPSIQADQDGDQLQDYFDADDDNDGIADANEADCDDDGIIDDWELDLIC